jgi:predicted dehydrogenase
MRLAIVGLGFMGGVHAKAIEQAQGVELAGVVSSDAKKRDAYPSAKHFSKLEAALADPSIEAVDLCIPTDLHESASIAALNAGKHVLVEKPMALDPAACTRMIAAAEKSTKTFMVAHVLRFFPAYKALIHAIEAKSLGKIRQATFRRRCAQPSWSEWITDASRTGGGAFDLLIHDIDMALLLFGAPSKISATGYIAPGVDTISARLFYSDDCVVEISGGWMFPGDFPFAMEFTVLGEAGVLEYNSESRPLKQYPKGELALETQDGYAAELEYFARCARTGEKPLLCDPRGSAESVRLALAIFDARKRSGETISWK